MVLVTSTLPAFIYFIVVMSANILKAFKYSDLAAISQFEVEFGDPFKY